MHVDEKSFALKVAQSQIAATPVVAQQKQQGKISSRSSSSSKNNGGDSKHGEAVTMAMEKHEIVYIFAAIGAGIMALVSIFAVMTLSERIARSSWASQEEEPPTAGYAESDEEEDDAYEEWLA
jgi:hypothetical protein